MKKNKSLPLISQDNRKEKSMMPLISYIGYAESGEEIKKLVEKYKNDIEEETKNIWNNKKWLIL